MLRISRGAVAGIVLGAVLLGGAGRLAAQAATTTTTTSTTTTTVPPHPFSDATGACLRRAKDAFRACKRGGTATTCVSQYQTAYSNCFAPGAGVTCAKRCITREGTCFAAVPTTRKTCHKACVTTRTRDLRACRQIADGDNLWAGGDGSCLATADANFHLCEFVCAQATLDCGTSLRFCVANCPNL